MGTESRNGIVFCAIIKVFYKNRVENGQGEGFCLLGFVFECSFRRFHLAIER